MRAVQRHPRLGRGRPSPGGRREAAPSSAAVCASRRAGAPPRSGMWRRLAAAILAHICGGAVSPLGGEERLVQPVDPGVVFQMRVLVGRPAEVRPVDLLENTPAKFRYWILGTDDLEQAVQTGEARLRERIAQAEEVLTLTAEQRSRLELAGRGDLHRFLDECEEYLRSVDWAAVSEPGLEDEAVLEGLLAESTRLQTRFCRGLHGADSLFHKTLTPWLTAEQQEAFQQRPQRFYGVTYGLRMR